MGVDALSLSLSVSKPVEMYSEKYTAVGSLVCWNVTAGE